MENQSGFFRPQNPAKAGSIGSKKPKPRRLTIREGEEHLTYGYNGEPSGKRDDGKPARVSKIKHTWKDVVSDLINHGFSMEEINDMTLSQLKLYVSAATKKAAIEQMQFISGVAVGAQSEGKTIKKSISQLEKSIEDM